MSAKRKNDSPSAKKATSSPKARKKPSTPRPDEMSDEVMDFITAIDDYKRKNQRPFPNWSEILEVLKGLGYERSEVN